MGVDGRRKGVGRMLGRYSAGPRARVMGSGARARDDGRGLGLRSMRHGQVWPGWCGGGVGRDVRCEGEWVKER